MMDSELARLSTNGAQEEGGGQCINHKKRIKTTANRFYLEKNA